MPATSTAQSSVVIGETPECGEVNGVRIRDGDVAVEPKFGEKLCGSVQESKTKSSKMSGGATAASWYSRVTILFEISSRL